MNDKEIKKIKDKIYYEENREIILQKKRDQCARNRDEFNSKRRFKYDPIKASEKIFQT